jgi:hypothetical protein
MTSARRVWIAQCLCPQRHAIVAAAGEADDRRDAERGILAELKTTVRRWLRADVINPHCGICHADKATWKFEVDRTPWATMDEAKPAIDRIAHENLATGMAYGEINGPVTKH